MKKVSAIFLCLALVMAAFVGCSSGGTSSKGESSQIVSETVSDGNSSSNGLDAEQAIAERKASGNLPKLTFFFYNANGTMAGTDRITGLINDYTSEELGLTIEINVMDMASFRQNVPLMCAAGEQVDIVASSGMGYRNAVNSGYLYDMKKDNLIDIYGADILNTIPDYILKGGYVGDSLYALTPMKDWAISSAAVCIATKYLDELGYDYESKWSTEDKESIPSTWEEVEKIFDEFKAKNPDKSAISTTFNYLGQGTIYDPVGGDWFGVLMDPANSLELSDIWSSQEFEDACKMFRRWNEKGFFPGDVLTTQLGLTAPVASGVCMSCMSQGKPGFRTQVSSMYGMDCVIFQVGQDIVKGAVPTDVCWSLGSGCIDPVAAMQFMNACYTDSYIENLLIWGEEGVDYVVHDDGRIGYPEGMDTNNAQWHHMVNWEMPSQIIGHVWETDSANLWERMQEFNDKAIKSKALGFSWDNSAYSAEYTALSNVYDEYFKSLICGAVDPEKTIPEFVEKLKAVGLDEYIAAKQDAINEWAKS